MLWNTLKDELCYLQNESESMKVSPLNINEVRILFDLEKPTLHLIYYVYYFFSTKTTGLAKPETVNVRKRQPWRHKVLVFWECEHR